MDYALEIKDLSKTYKEFSLQVEDLSLPRGCIMGFVGENGSGKTTIIKLILDLIHRNSGEIKVLGKDNIKYQKEIKEQIGIVFDDGGFPENIKISNINSIMKNIYKAWDCDVFNSYCKRFSLSQRKIFKELSRGMKMKLSIAVALSHNAKFLILDEATSGLDPIVRDEILDVFQEFIQNEENSIFMSSHITSDLEKVADYITFIHKGKIILNEPKDELIDTYGVLKCSKEEFKDIDKSLIIGHRKSKFNVEALVLKNKLKDNYIIDSASIDDIMLFFTKGAK